MAYFVLFISALGAATLLPLSSEVTLVALLTQKYNVYLLWLAASMGNFLGALINYYLSYYVRRFESKSWFPVSSKKLSWAHDRFERYGSWSLLFSWLPIVGDALTVIAGTLKMNILLFSVLVFLGKAIRYAVVIYLFSLSV